MGRIVCAYLAYGYDLGGADRWKFGEVDEHGGIALDWYHDDEEHEVEPFDEQAESRLSRILAGFTENDWTVDGYFQRRRQAWQERVGVEFVSYGYGQEPLSYVLATHMTYASWEGREEVDLADLERRRVAENWDAKLDAAVAALSITPHQERPRWLITAYSD